MALRQKVLHQDLVHSEHQEQLRQLAAERGEVDKELHETRQQLQNVTAQLLLISPREEADRKDQRMHVYGDRKSVV